MSSELICVATYNEVGNIEQLVSLVASHRPSADLLVIDDSSPDGTSEAVLNLTEKFSQIRLIRRPRKAGLRSAHLMAMNIALRLGYNHLVTLDADLSHQPSEIADLVEVLPQGGFSIGTRMHGGSHQGPLLRRILSRSANSLAMALLPTGLSEYTSSFRVYSPQALEVLVQSSFQYHDYAFFIEVIETLYRSSIPMVETPINFLDRASGKSKIPRAQILTSSYALAGMAGTRIRTRVKQDLG